MKLQLPANSAVPAVLAAASISLSLLLLPSGGASVRSSGLAPALKLVAGDVVEAAARPVRVVTRAQPKPVASPAVSVARTREQTQLSSVPFRSRGMPAHRLVHRSRVSPTTPVTRAPVTVRAASREAARRAVQPTVKLVGHGHGKAKAWGLLRKAKAWGLRWRIVPLPLAARTTAATGGHGEARGHTLAAPPGPGAVPPGREKGGQVSDAPSASSGRGGGT
jgi:hypothetical protein